jgi:phenylacetate-coenzyme A ligase PaaK-like adenylate-forming protein
MKTTQTQEINKRIKHAVTLSKEIPFYARKYKELGINPDTIKTPQDLLKAYEKGLYTTPQDLPELVYYKHPEAKGPFYTSGTAGKPKEIWLNPDQDRWIISQFSVAYGRILLKSDRILNLLPREPAVSGFAIDIFLSALNYRYQHFPSQEVRADIRKFIDAWTKFSPTCIICLTTFAYRLPLMLKASNIESRLRSVIVGAEPSSIERRKHIGEEFEAMVYDSYATSESMIVAQEITPFSDEHVVTYPDTLLFLVKDGHEVSQGESGDVLLTNLYNTDLMKPWMVLLNYKIGDQAKCLENENSGTVTVIGNIRRETAYLAGAKLNPQEVEAVIDGLDEFKGFLTGEYCIITYSDRERKAVAEIRLEAKKQLTNEQKKQISQQVRQQIYSVNFPVWDVCENVKDGKLIINITEPRQLYKGYEHLIKPGKPKRLIVL